MFPRFKHERRNEDYQLSDQGSIVAQCRFLCLAATALSAHSEVKRVKYS